jgi:uncharacterized phage protein (TIGR01671 family)
MNRNVKFKVWDGVDYISQPFNLSDIQKGNIQFSDNCVVLQFTGLQDRNNDDIYEGDLLKWNTRDGSVVGQVVWEQQACAFWFKWHDGAYHRYKELCRTSYSDDEVYKNENIEVVGNMYENSTTTLELCKAAVFTAKKNRIMKTKDLIRLLLILTLINTAMLIAIVIGFSNIKATSL